MPIEHKAQRPSSRLLAHLNWLLDEALEQTFPASDPVAIDIDRESHDREARVFDSRALGARTNSAPPVIKIGALKSNNGRRSGVIRNHRNDYATPIS
jgi:hypothetical protein